MIPIVDPKFGILKWVTKLSWADYKSDGWVNAREYYMLKEASYAKMRKSVEQEIIKRNLNIE